MYELVADTLYDFIKASFPTLDIYDATETFKEPDSYASFYILNQDPTSPHENLIDESGVNEVTHSKIFTFKETEYINIKVDFRGDNAHSNMATFKSSFLQETKKEVLKEAGLGFLGLGAIEPITSLRDSKAKGGSTTTLKLIGATEVTDESPIIDEIVVTVSNTL